MDLENVTEFENKGGNNLKEFETVHEDVADEGRVLVEELFDRLDSLVAACRDSLS